MIKTVAPYISADTKNFEVVCTIADKIRDLRPGMYIYIKFVLNEKENLYYLPFTALVSDKNLWFVTKDGSANSFEYTVQFSNNDYFEIPPEYKDYQIIVDGQNFIRSGQKVKVISNAEMEADKK